MASTAHIQTADGNDSPDAIVADIGLPKYNRRLNDKILASFNDACAVGELEVAAPRHYCAELGRSLDRVC